MKPSRDDLELELERLMEAAWQKLLPCSSRAELSRGNSCCGVRKHPLLRERERNRPGPISAFITNKSVCADICPRCQDGNLKT